MEENEILSQITGLFRKILKRENIELTPETTANDVEGWDSLTHLVIIESVEKHFSIKFRLSEIMKFHKVGDMVSCIKNKKG